MIRVDCALTGVRLAEFRSNDLADIGYLHNRMSSFLLLPSSRIRLLYEGELVDPMKEGSQGTVMNRVQFNRSPILQCVLIEPTHCSVCLSEPEELRCYRFQRGNGPRNYTLCQVPGRSQLDDCYCQSVVTEFGWKVIRNWTHIMRSLWRDQTYVRLPMAPRSASVFSSDINTEFETSQFALANL